MLVPDQSYLVKSLTDIDPEKVYFLVYVREKTEEEIEEEENVSKFKSVLNELWIIVRKRTKWHNIQEYSSQESHYFNAVAAWDQN